jgi:hypothetical protein
MRNTHPVTQAQSYLCTQTCPTGLRHMQDAKAVPSPTMSPPPTEDTTRKPAKTWSYTGPPTATCPNHFCLSDDL